MTERVTVTDDAVYAACVANLHPDAIPSETEMAKMRRSLEAAAPLIVAEERARIADKVEGEADFYGWGSPDYHACSRIASAIRADTGETTDA
jgi:hypothetical protein